MSRKSKLAIRLETLIAAAQARLHLEENPEAARGERKAVCEEHDINLMDAMGGVSRLIDPEHR